MSQIIHGKGSPKESFNRDDTFDRKDPFQSKNQLQPKDPFQNKNFHFTKMALFSLTTHFTVGVHFTSNTYFLLRLSESGLYVWLADQRKFFACVFSPLKNLKLVKNTFTESAVYTVEGYIRLTLQEIAKSFIPQQIIDLILFFYAKPIIINLKYNDKHDYVLYNTLSDSWRSIIMKISLKFK